LPARSGLKVVLNVMMVIYSKLKVACNTRKASNSDIASFYRVHLNVKSIRLRNARTISRPDGGA
jgi:hypothetical protein